VLGEAHLRRVLKQYAAYHNQCGAETLRRHERSCR
jgi:hypothetical protein